MLYLQVHAEGSVPCEKNAEGGQLVQSLFRPLFREHEHDRLHVQKCTAHTPASTLNSARAAAGGGGREKKKSEKLFIVIRKSIAGVVVMYVD